MTTVNELLLKMTEYYSGDPMRTQHFYKVYEFSRLIGEEEHLDDQTLFILTRAAIVHDIGIKPAEEKYHSSMGKYQEELGPEPAKKMLTELGYDEKVIDRIAYLVGHHHTYSNIDGLDYQILVEADFIVNMYEDKLSPQAIQAALKNIFKTKTGIMIAKTMFNA